MNVVSRQCTTSANYCQPFNLFRVDLFEQSSSESERPEYFGFTQYKFAEGQEEVLTGFVEPTAIFIFLKLPKMLLVEYRHCRSGACAFCLFFVSQAASFCG